MSPWMKIMQELVWFTQLGVSLVVPPLACAWGGWWLIHHMGWPIWFMMVAILVGLGASGASFLGFYRHVCAKARKPKPQSGPAFNEHR